MELSKEQLLSELRNELNQAEYKRLEERVRFLEAVVMEQAATIKKLLEN